MSMTEGIKFLPLFQSPMVFTDGGRGQVKYNLKNLIISTNVSVSRRGRFGSDISNLAFFETSQSRPPMSRLHPCRAEGVTVIT